MMMSPVARRLDPWLDLTRESLARPGLFPRRLLLGHLFETFQCLVGFHHRDGASISLAMHDPIPGWPTPELFPLWLKEGPRLHPVIRWYAATGDLTAMSMGRVPNGILAPRSRGIARDLFLPGTLTQQLVIPIAYEESVQTAFVLAKDGSDYTGEDLELARRIQPLILLMARHYAVASETVGKGADLGLTERELVVLGLLARGLTAAAIGRRLSISARTVHVHLQNIYRKLEVNDRLLAVRLYHENATASGPASVPTH